MQTIATIELFKFSIPLIEPFVTSLGTDLSADNILVRISTSEGLTGFGEGSPYAPIHGETLESCMVVGQKIARLLKGRDALDIEGNTRAMDQQIYANTCIKSAFDMALYDIASQNAGVPLYKFLGGENNRPIATDYTVSLGDIPAMVLAARKIHAQGYPAIKVKLGRDGRVDVERIRAIREAVGEEVPLRIDANQGWEVQEAIDSLKAMKSFGIEFCEEPIARWNFLQLPRVKRESPIPIMADECCGNDHDAERLIALDACQAMNIKLSKSGGIFTGLRMVRLAERAGIVLQVGAMIESRLGMTAFAHFALCSSSIRYCDFDTALMFSEDPVAGGIHYAPNGTITMPETPGLGAMVDDSWLLRMEKVTV